MCDAHTLYGSKVSFISIIQAFFQLKETEQQKYNYSLNSNLSSPHQNQQTMADEDDWENDNFEVKIPVLNNKANWEEEDQVELDANKPPPPPTASALAEMAKKKKEEELKLANAVKFASLENETSDERKARERRQVEDADNELTGELFGGKADGTSSSTEQKASSSSLASMVAGTSLKSKDDHKNFGIICAKKMSDSTAFNVAAFYKSLTEKLESKFTSETIEEVLVLFNKIKEEKKKTEPAKTVQKKSKSQVKAETKKHSDIFGGGDYDDQYAAYGASKYKNIPSSSTM